MKENTGRNTNERSLWGVRQLTARSLVLGSLGSIIITASSMYVALRMSALPWPTIFVSVLSMALLKALGKTTLNEVNITQSAMSAGAMVAGGLAFTLPGLWISGAWNDTTLNMAHFWRVLAVAGSGVTLGTLLTWLLRPRFVDSDKYPYPIGAAAAETISTGDAGGRKGYVLFGTMGFSAIFTYMRDSLGWIPAAISPKWLYARNLFLGVWVSPMAAAIGYIIGPLYVGVWFAGAVLAYLIIVPLGPKVGLFETVQAAIAFKNTAGLGLMVGTGLGVLVNFVYFLVKGADQEFGRGVAKTVKSRTAFTGLTRFLTVGAVAVALVITTLSGIGIIPSILVMVGIFATSAMSATLTGQTGINPMEIFGIIVLLGIRLFVEVDTVSAFFVAGCVAVACGQAGDILNEYKAGRILGSNPVAQLISQAIGGLVGAFVASAALFAIIGQFGGVGMDKGLPAGQAFAVASMVKGIGDPAVFGAALAIGILLYLFRVPSMTLGLGMYLPFEITSVVTIGGLVKYVMDKVRPGSEPIGNIASSGVLGGEGITGVATAIIKMIMGG